MRNSPARGDVVMLDRDGTLVADRGYLADPDGLEFVAGAADGVRSLFAAGYRLIVISNQSGIGRGYFALDCMELMNLRLRQMVHDAGAELEGIYFCPHAPEAGCDCRKPAQRLLLQAIADLNFDPVQSVMIGDTLSDVEFGRRAGATTILIAGAAPPGEMQARADFVVPDFAAAVRVVLRRKR